MIDPVLEYRLSQIQSRINEDRFLKNNGSGNEIGFWIFDYPAQCELQVSVVNKLAKYLDDDSIQNRITQNFYDVPVRELVRWW